MGRDKSVINKIRQKRKNRHRRVSNPYKSRGNVLQKPWAIPFKRFLKKQQKEELLQIFRKSEAKLKLIQEREFQQNGCATNELYRGSSCWPDAGVTPNEMAPYY